MSLMDLILVTVNECNVVIIDNKTSAVKIYEKHDNIPFTDLRRTVTLVRGFENHMMIWID